VKSSVERAARWLAEAGYAVEKVETPSYGRAVELWMDLQRAELRHFMWPLIEAHGDEGARTSVGYLLSGGAGAGPDDYMKLLAERTRSVRDWGLFLERYPLVLTPVSLEPPFVRGFDTASQAGMDEALLAQHPQLMVPLLATPAIAVPTGLAAGLPMGVQLMAARFREDLCLDAAEVIEARAPALTPIDPVW
jgi:amidase